MYMYMYMFCTYMCMQEASRFVSHMETYSTCTCSCVYRSNRHTYLYMYMYNVHLDTHNVHVHVHCIYMYTVYTCTCTIHLYNMYDPISAQGLDGKTLAEYKVHGRGGCVCHNPLTLIALALVLSLAVLGLLSWSPQGPAAIVAPPTTSWTTVRCNTNRCFR